MTNETTVALLGDSTIDNGRYTSGGPNVPGYLQFMLGHRYNVLMYAEDGATTADIYAQTDYTDDEDIDLVILSVGGNDVLPAEGLLHMEADTIGSGMAVMAKVVDAFRADYVAMLDSVLARFDVPVLACTIYNGWFGGMALPVSAAAGMFNDVILSECAKRGIDVLDLRNVVNRQSDFYNAIEPGNIGGSKIAAAFASWVVGDRFQFEGRTRGQSLMGWDADVEFEPTVDDLFDAQMQELIADDPYRDEAMDRREDSIRANLISEIRGLGRRAGEDL